MKRIFSLTPVVPTHRRRNKAAKRNRKLQLESLEPRIALAADYSFFSGVIDVDGTIAGGDAFTAVNLGQAGGGVAYNNVWNASTGGVVVPGNSYKQTATGFFPITQVRVGNANSNLLTGQRLVAVYAFEGVNEDNPFEVDPNITHGNFDPSASVPNSTFADGKAHSVVRIYNFGAVDPGLSDTDPTTWIPGAGSFLENINNPANIVAELRIDFQADSYRMGPPGQTGAAGATTLPQVINPLAVNTLPGDTTGATLESRGDIKLIFNPDFIGTANDALNLLFNDPIAMSAFGDLTPPNIDPLVTPDLPGVSKQAQVVSPTTGELEDAFDLFTNLDFLAFAQAARPIPSGANIANINTLFDALLDSPFGGSPGNHPFSDQATPGNDLNTGQIFVSGDITFRNQNVSAIPGAQFKEQAIKEGRKYYDLNADGDDEGGTDPGLANWTILAFAEIGTPDGELSQAEIDAGPAATAVTGLDGSYSMTLDPGAYIVVEQIPAPPPEWFESPDDDTTEVNPNSLGGFGNYGYVIELEGGEIDSGNDFANYQKARKSGVKFHDRNANGARDPGDEGLADWTINLVGTDGKGNPVNLSVLTADGVTDDLDGDGVIDPIGFYWFEVNPGTYTVSEVLQSDWYQSYPDIPGDGDWDIVLTSGQNDTNNDFGNYQLARKSGYKFHDRNADGKRDAGDEGLADWTINLDGTDGMGNPVHLSVQTADGVTDDLDGDGVIDPIGFYWFEVKPGTYTVSEVLQPDWYQSYPDIPGDGDWDIVLTSGQNDTKNDFGNYRLATKSGYKFHDRNANGARDPGDEGLADWTINLVGTDGMGNPVHLSVLTADGVTDDLDGDGLTDSIGFYWFEVKPGTYTVSEVLKPDWYQSYPDIPGDGDWDIVLTSGQNEDKNDFGNYQKAYKSGRKFQDQPVGEPGSGVNEPTDPGLAGWTIHLAGTDGKGNAVDLQVQTADGISDDLDDDGVVDPIGFYWFVVNPGNYLVYEELENGWVQTYPVAGAGIEAAPNGTLGYRIILESGDADTDNDFGNVEEGEGLTPGFWKANAANAARRPEKFGEPGTGIPLAWVDTGIVPDDLLEDEGFIGFPAGTSFVEALNTGGGGINALMRHAAAAYLNALHPCVDYPLTADEIVEMVNQAIEDGEAAIETLKDQLDGYNNFGADLDQFGRCADDAAMMLVTKGGLMGPSTAYSAISTSTGVMVVDEAVSVTTSDSSESAISVVSTYQAPPTIDSSATASSVQALDVAFDSVAAYRDSLLLADSVGSDDNDDARTDVVSSDDEDAEFEPMVSALDDVFELLSVE